MKHSHRPSALAAVQLGLALALISVCLTACQSSPPGAALQANRVSREDSPARAMNDQLARAAVSARSQRGASDYRVGPGDVIEISVFQVEELSRTVRVRPDGSISLPLLGSLAAAGCTTSALERRLAEQLGAEYLWNPQVSVFLKEFRAHPVSVLGEVSEPGVFYLQEPRTLVEILSEAGGLTKDAGTTVHLRRKARNPETGYLEFELLTLDLHAHLERGGSGPDLQLRDDDTVYVPKAGVVFVEGAVEKPDVYPLQGGATVLKAITMAGGISFKARKSGIQLIRAGEGEPEVIRLDLAGITRSPANDVLLRDGDVVVVGSHPIKVGLHGIWRGFAGLVRVSAGL